MTSARMPRLAAAILSAAAIVPPASAQPATPAPLAPPAVSPPPAWSVTTNEAIGAVRLAATSKEGGVQFVIACKESEPGISGFFSRYQGSGLRTDGATEAVALYAQGAEWRDAFTVRIRYAAANRTWVFAQPLSPIFLASFSRGATLSVVNARNQEVFSFDLTGSTAATRAMRTTCGFS